MNRHELQERVREHLGGTATPMAAQLALDAVLRAITDGLTEDGEVKLARFGTFRIKQRAPRKLLLPGTGKIFILPERTSVTFHAH